MHKKFNQHEVCLSSNALFLYDMLLIRLSSAVYAVLIHWSDAFRLSVFIAFKLFWSSDRELVQTATSMEFRKENTGCTDIWLWKLRRYSLNALMHCAALLPHVLAAASGRFVELSLEIDDCDPIVPLKIIH